MHPPVRLLQQEENMGISIDEKTLAGLRMALTAYKFKLCEPPPHDGRHDVYLAMVARRDRQLEAVKQLLDDTKSLTNAKASTLVQKAFE